jgi:hypothetical protein
VYGGRKYAAHQELPESDLSPAIGAYGLLQGRIIPIEESTLASFQSLASPTWAFDLLIRGRQRKKLVVQAAVALHMLRTTQEQARRYTTRNGGRMDRPLILPQLCARAWDSSLQTRFHFLEQNMHSGSKQPQIKHMAAIRSFAALIPCDFRDIKSLG